MTAHDKPTDLELFRAVYKHLDMSALLRQFPGISKKRVNDLFRRLADQLGPPSSARLQSAVIYADGGSHGNPGPAAGAFVLLDENGEGLLEGAEYLGHATSNVAEYHGVTIALQAALQLGAAEVLLRSDSKLLVRQIEGSFKVKAHHLKPLHARVVGLLARFAKWRVEHVPREQNKRADALVGAEINAHKKAPRDRA